MPTRQEVSVGEDVEEKEPSYTAGENTLLVGTSTGTATVEEYGDPSKKIKNKNYHMTQQSLFWTST